MAKNNSLGDRIKENYENRSKTYLTRRTPCMIRLDGRSFHVFTRGFVKPFDERFIEAMQETTLELCKNIQGCVFGYTQSDEITLILVDYEHLDSSAWFDYSVQKLCSVSASMCTMYFNRIFSKNVLDFMKEHEHIINDKEHYGDVADQVKVVFDAYKKALELGATFDSRCFSVPKEEVTNAVLFRQQDATRNSINSLAQSYFKYQELHGKNTSEMQDMLFNRHGINWNDLEAHEKRGTAIVHTKDYGWVIDKEMPILVGDGRNYIESRINFE